MTDSKRKATKTDHKIGTRKEWLAASGKLLEREKEHTKLGDELARQRRGLPWLRVGKGYSFETAEGPKTLAELFDGRSQLAVYHFMFGPDYEAGCTTCSSIADGFNWASSYKSDFNLDLGFSNSEDQTREWVTPMLKQLPSIADKNAREAGTDVVSYLSENQGFSVFVLEDGAVYQTYSTGARGVEFLMGFYGILDRVPKGRDEDEKFQVWIRRHDEYGSQ